MIHLVTGVPGSGKSLYTSGLILEALRKGKWVATNVGMVDDFAERAAAIQTIRWLRPGSYRRQVRRNRERMIVSGDLDYLMALRMPEHRGRGSGEGRGIMVLDEAHLWLNTRAFRDSDRPKLVAWFSQHRKLGWDVYLITQSEKSIDQQIARLAEYEIRLRNLKKFRVAGIPVTGGANVFLAVWRWSNEARSKPMRRQMFTLRRRVAGLYDTLHVHETGADELGLAEVVQLPLTPHRDAGAPRPAAPAAGARRRRAEGERIAGAVGASSTPSACRRFDPHTGAAYLVPVPSERPPAVGLARLRPAWLGG